MQGQVYKELNVLLGCKVHEPWAESVGKKPIPETFKEVYLLCFSAIKRLPEQAVLRPVASWRFL